MLPFFIATLSHFFCPNKKMIWHGCFLLQLKKEQSTDSIVE